MVSLRLRRIVAALTHENHLVVLCGRIDDQLHILNISLVDPQATLHLICRRNSS